MLFRSLMAIGAAIIAFAGYGSAAFIGSFYFRNHAVEAAAAAKTFGLGTAGFLGLALGIIGGIAGILGSYLGGVLGDRLGKKGPQGQMTLVSIAAIAGAPFYIAGMLSPSMVTAMTLLAIPTFLNSMWYGPIYGSVQGLVRPQTRATAAAVILFIINLIGLGFGPPFVGWLADVMTNRAFATHSLGDFKAACAAAAQPGAAADLVAACGTSNFEGVKWAILITAVVFYAWAGLHYVYAARFVKRDLEAGPVS